MSKRSYRLLILLSIQLSV